MPKSSSSNPCLFSGISGVITLDGLPARQAHIRREVTRAHKSGKKTDTAVADENGFFEMPPIFDSVFMAKFWPMEFSVEQTISVAFNSNEYTIWEGIKRKTHEDVESNGKPLVVDCELSRPEKKVRVGGGVIYSKCTWDVIPDRDTKVKSSELLIDDDDI